VARRHKAPHHLLDQGTGEAHWSANKERRSGVLAEVFLDQTLEASLQSSDVLVAALECVQTVALNLGVALEAAGLAQLVALVEGDGVQFVQVVDGEVESNVEVAERPTFEHTVAGQDGLAQLVGLLD
jgi:hypothetical protein